MREKTYGRRKRFFFFASRGNIAITLVLLLIIAASLILVAGSPSGIKGGENLIPENYTAKAPKKSLQIDKINFIVPTVAQPTVCGEGPQIFPTSTFPNGQCCVVDGPAPSADDCCNNDDVGSLGGYKHWCNAKPVIYLYPKEKAIVDVRLTVPGSIVESIPYYPQAGWENIETYPDGTMYYQGNKYRELYYEASISLIDPPQKGFLIPVQDLSGELSRIVTLLGLIPQEKDEFLSYWIPKLKALGTPYTFVSVFDDKSKQIIDKVEISPKPDTLIEFIMYYKPVTNIYHVKKLELPSTPPARIGFTAVEWGGIIDK